MRRFSLGLFFWVLVAIPGAAAAAGSGEAGLRLYSDYCLHEESGDVLGIRIGILDLEDGPYVVYQEAFGWPGKAQIIKLEKKDFENSKITFSVEGSGGTERFQGVVTAKQITGRFDGHRFGPRGNAVFKLSRVTLPRKGFPACR